MADPWDPVYKTIDEAAIAALDEIYPASRTAQIEYAVAIYEDKRTLLYGFTDFVTDGNRLLVTLIGHLDSDFVAQGHTHPCKPIEGCLPHDISNHKEAARILGLPMYWIAPNGTVHVYEPTIRKRRIVRAHHNRPNIVR